MEKKNLGRGLEDISNIFLSTAKKEDNKKQTPGNGFSAIKIRDDTCASCVEMVEGSSREPKCRIFSIEDKKYKVPHLETITMNYANYCDYFTPAAQKEEAAPKQIISGSGETVTANCEIEETVTIRKKIAYQDTETTQQDIKRALLKYLDDGYSLMMVELAKAEESSQSTNRQTRREEIIILGPRSK
jgi:hypothetical protein